MDPVDSDPQYCFLPITDPRSRGQKGTGSRIRIPSTVLSREQYSWFILERQVFLIKFQLGLPRVYLDQEQERKKLQKTGKERNSRLDVLAIIFRGCKLHL